MKKSISVFRTLFCVKMQSQIVSVLYLLSILSLIMKHCCAFPQIELVVHWGKTCGACILEVRWQRIGKCIYSIEIKCLIDIFWPLFIEHIQEYASSFSKRLNARFCLKGYIHISVLQIWHQWYFASTCRIWTISLTIFLINYCWDFNTWTCPPSSVRYW